jgi:universal stress protein A
MEKYQHLLLAADYSEHGDLVARKALNLCSQFQAKLSIIHVLDNIAMPDMAPGTIIPLDENSNYELLEAEKTKLQQTADKLGIEQSRRWLVWGSPKQEIVHIAEQEKIDLIVVGSHGRHGLAMLLGSTANGILHYAKCDVMAVRLQDD